MKAEEQILVVSVPSGSTVIRDNVAGGTYNTPVFPRGTKISLRDVPSFEANEASHKELVERMLKAEERCEKAEQRCKEAELRALESALRAEEAEKAAKYERSCREEEARCYCGKIGQLRREVNYWKSMGNCANYAECRLYRYNWR